MKIIRNNKKYLKQLVELVEEYREFCGFSRSPEKTKTFLQHLLDSKGSVTLIAVEEEPERLLGVANLYPSYSTLSLQPIWILNDLAVSKRFQGQGIARSLIKEVITFARETDAARIELKTQISNINAQRLYSSLGFAADDKNIYYSVPT